MHRQFACGACRPEESLPAMLMESEPSTGKPPGLNIRALLQQHAGENYDLQSQHINPANVRTLKTIGFDHCYVRAE